MALEDDEYTELKLIVSTATDNPSLTEWERSFVADFAGRIEQYGDDTRVSSKQWEILRRIYTDKC